MRSYELGEDLGQAALRGDAVRVRALLAQGANPNFWDSFSALDAACETDRPDIVKILLDAGASGDGSSSDGITPLQKSSQVGSVACVRLLLNHGVKVNEIGRDRRAALHWAAEADSVECARLLLDHGASLEIRDHEGRTAPDLAKANGSNRVLALMEAARLRAKRGGILPVAGPARPTQ